MACQPCPLTTQEVSLELNPYDTPRNSADMGTCIARESFQSASTDTAFSPRSTWLM